MAAQNPCSGRNKPPRIAAVEIEQVFYNSTKKTFYHNFFPTKAEENSYKRQKVKPDLSSNRSLVEIRDYYPAPSQHLWKIKRVVSQDDIKHGKIMISFIHLFEHVLRYWIMDSAKLLTEGRRIGVPLWDVTSKENPKKYQNDDVYMWMTKKDNCVISCSELMRDRYAKAGDELFLYWDKNSGLNAKIIVKID